MSTLLVVGAGGHGRVVADAAMSSGVWNAIAFIDDRTDVTSVLGCPIVGTCADLERLRTQYEAVAVGIGQVHRRLELLDRCEEIGFRLPCIVHATAAVSNFAAMANGCVVFAHSAVNPGAVLGRGCIVNTGATVDHDCELGEGVHVCPGVHCAGSVSIGPRSWIGIGSCVKQGVRIGSDVTVGAGAAVVSDVASGLTVVGVPARAK